jgi:transglutaminase-like putative cysteine protease
VSTHQPDTLRASIAHPRSRRPRAASDDWRTSLLLFITLVVVVAGLHVILTGTVWLVQLGFVSLLVFGAAAVARLLTTYRWVPPLVAAAATVAALTAAFAPSTAFLAVIPTGDTFALFSKILDQAGVSINEQTLPAQADLGVTFVLCIGVASVAIAADIIAIPLGAPALAGLPLLVMLGAPAWIDPGSSDPITFILAVLAYLLLLRVGSRRGQAQLSIGLGAAIVALTIVLTVVLPSPNGTSLAGNGLGNGVNPVLTLGNDLRQGSDRTVLSYKTSAATGEYLRLVSVSDFSGSNWQPDAENTARKNTVDKIGAPPGLTKAIARVPDITTVTVGTLSSSLLPLPYPASKVTGLKGTWLWSSPGLSVTSTDQNTAGQKYTITDAIANPTPDQLLAAGTTVPAGLGRYLQVPAGLPAIVTTTAKQVVGTAPTNYQKALLLQSFFHDGDFTYSETAPVDQGYDGTGGQVIAKFLQVKAGYCIHFAAAMAVMARTLGIPARISVGFLPGQEVSATRSDATFDVSTHDLHAWPELYFAGIGWTRFEPTVSRGVAPAYADPNDPAVPPVSAADNSLPAKGAGPSAPAVAPTAVPTRHAVASGGAGSVSGGSSSWIWVALVVLVIALLALMPGILRSAQRSRRIRRLASARSPALLGWREVLQTSADVGNPIEDTLTPREAAVALGVDARPSLERMLAALERERFAKDPRAYPGAADDTRDLVSALFATAKPRTRVAAVLFPRSLWERITRRPAAP